VSIYFPWAVLSPDYWGRPFAKATHWPHFLKSHLKATQRERRYEERPPDFKVVTLLRNAGLTPSKAGKPSASLLKQVEKNLLAKTPAVRAVRRPGDRRRNAPAAGVRATPLEPRELVVRRLLKLLPYAGSEQGSEGPS